MTVTQGGTQTQAERLCILIQLKVVCVEKNLEWAYFFVCTKGKLYSLIELTEYFLIVIELGW